MIVQMMEGEAEIQPNSSQQAMCPDPEVHPAGGRSLFLICINALHVQPVVLE